RGDVMQMIKGDRVPIKVWARVDEVDSNAIRQLRNITTLPWVAYHVAVMPDVHLGKGATVGSVIAMSGAVSLAAWGVVIGCGMEATKTSLSADDLPDSLRSLRNDLEAAIPVGPLGHTDPAWRNMPGPLKQDCQHLLERFDKLDAKAASRLEARASYQLGSL